MKTIPKRDMMNHVIYLWSDPDVQEIQQQHNNNQNLWGPFLKTKEELFIQKKDSRSQHPFVCPKNKDQYYQEKKYIHHNIK